MSFCLLGLSVPDLRNPAVLVGELEDLGLVLVHVVVALVDGRRDGRPGRHRRVRRGQQRRRRRRRRLGRGVRQLH